MIGVIALFGLATSIYLLFFHHGLWRADQRLPEHAESLAEWPSVVAVVPARNEAETIGAVTAALCAQDYPGSFRVIMVDDSSTDGTADLARATAGHRLDVLSAPPLARPAPGRTGRPRGMGGHGGGLWGAEDPEGLWAKPLGGLAIASGSPALWRHDLRFRCGPLATAGWTMEGPKL